jgi:hypothetical protein
VLDAGACPGSPGRWAIDGTAGPGCVGLGAWENAKRAIWTLTQPAAQLVERRPAPLDPVKVVLPDGGVLELTGPARIGDRDADPAAVLELVAALATPAEPVAVPPGKPLGALVVTDRGGRSIALELHAPRVVVRRGEPIGLRVGEGAWERLVRPSATLRDPTPWREEPTTITALELDGTTYTRGAVIGEWTRAGPGRDDPAAVEQLAGALAAPRVRPHARGGAMRHVVTLHVKPPGGAPVQRTIRIGEGPGGCHALAEGAPLSVAPEICALVRRLK